MIGAAKALVMLAALLLVAAGGLRADRNQLDAILMQGQWELVSAQDDGQFLGTDHNRITVGATHWRAGKVVFRYVLHPCRRPKQIDWIRDGKVSWRGIYELEPDTLRLCLAPHDQPRPAEFVTVAGDQRQLHVRSRVPPPAPEEKK